MPVAEALLPPAPLPTIRNDGQQDRWYLGERQMGIYQGPSEYKPDAQASASILAYTRLRFGLVLVRK